MDAHPVLVGADELGLGVHQDSDLESDADLPGVLDPETHLERHLDIVAVQLVTFEAIHVAVLLEHQGVGGIRIHDPAVGEVVMTAVTETDADGMFLALAEREVIGQRRAESLVEHTRIPVVVGGELEIVEEIQVDRKLLVRLVGDQLGIAGDREDQGDQRKEDFLHGRFAFRLETAKIGKNFISLPIYSKFGNGYPAERRSPRRSTPGFSVVRRWSR